MATIDRRYEGFWRAARAFNKQPADVRARVVGEYFDIAAIVLPDDGPSQRLRLYGMREAQRFPARKTGVS